MDRKEIIDRVADYFGIEPDYDLNSYDWTAGCHMGTMWLCPAEIVHCIECEFGEDLEDC